MIMQCNFNFGCRDMTEAVDKLESILFRYKWITAKQLSSYGYNDRELRLIASGSKGRIITGNRGYCHISKATGREIAECRERLRSQIDKMSQRVIEIDAACAEYQQTWEATL